MLRFRRSSLNGVQHLLFIHGFRQLALYSTSIESNPNFVKYLVENLGLSKQQALSTSSTFTRYRLRHGATKVSDFDKFDSVVGFLKKIGLEQSHIRNVVVVEPLILKCKVDKTLAPKFEALQKLGFSRPHIAEIVSANPTFLFNGLDTAIIPTVENLREIMDCEGDVISVLKKLRRVHLAAGSKRLMQNVALFRSYGIWFDSIRKFLLRKPAVFLQKTDYLQNAVTRIEQEWGIPRNSPQLLVAAGILITFSKKNIESKMQIYKSFGWTTSDIVTLMTSNSFILGATDDNIKKKLDFLMNELGYEPTYLASQIHLFTCSLDKRILPRHKVLLILKENGLIVTSFSSVVGYTESKFLIKYVLPFKEVHEVYCKFAGISLEKLTLKSSHPNSTAL